MGGPAMDSGWYYALRSRPAGGQVGPVGWNDLVAYARAGAFGPDDLVWNQQLADWRPASQVPSLFQAPAAPVASAPVYQIPSYAPVSPGYAAPAYAAAQPANWCWSTGTGCRASGVSAATR